MVDQQATVETILELDLIVTQNPTNVWLLSDGDVADFKCYEQWEKGRPFKAKAVYHHPSGVDFYLKNEGDPYGVRDTDTSHPHVDNELSLAPERPGKRHKVGADETVYSIALDHKISPTKLMDHNEITDGKKVRPGMWLYIPRPEPEKRKHIEYRLLAEPRPMHVTRPGGTNKWTFGAVRTWKDIKEDAKRYAEGQNVDIYAVAKVPVEGEVAAYYMDKHDLGQYKDNGGRVAYTRGFNWQHLAEGYVTAEEKLTVEAKAMADAMMEDDRKEPPEYVEPAAEAVPEAPETPEVIEVADEPNRSPDPAPADYKATFRYLNVEESPELYRLLEDMDIRELDGESMPVHKKADSVVKISGWFTHEGTPYYRVATRYWFAIPTHKAYSIEDEVFNDIPTDLASRVASGGYLTPSERRLAAIAKTVARMNKLKTLPGLIRQRNK